ncbi:MAG: hypothetical protein QOD33_765 [Pyrinomonadaceae bacterium]|jgi:hypothetical protein|nr:hypothetical protein [Pyrinomonadaceae bacterium]
MDTRYSPKVENAHERLFAGFFTLMPLVSRYTTVYLVANDSTIQRFSFAQKLISRTSWDMMAAQKVLNDSKRFESMNCSVNPARTPPTLYPEKQAVDFVLLQLDFSNLEIYCAGSLYLQGSFQAHWGPHWRNGN